MFNLHLQEEKVLKYLTFPAEQQKTSTASLSVHTHTRGVDLHIEHRQMKVHKQCDTLTDVRQRLFWAFTVKRLSVNIVCSIITPYNHSLASVNALL